MKDKRVKVAGAVAMIGALSHDIMTGIKWAMRTWNFKVLQNEMEAVLPEEADVEPVQSKAVDDCLVKAEEIFKTWLTERLATHIKKQSMKQISRTMQRVAAAAQERVSGAAWERLGVPPLKELKRRKDIKDREEAEALAGQKYDMLQENRRIDALPRSERARAREVPREWRAADRADELNKSATPADIQMLADMKRQNICMRFKDKEGNYRRDPTDGSIIEAVFVPKRSPTSNAVIVHREHPLGTRAAKGGIFEPADGAQQWRQPQDSKDGLLAAVQAANGEYVNDHGIALDRAKLVLHREKHNEDYLAAFNFWDEHPIRDLVGGISPNYGRRSITTAARGDPTLGPLALNDLRQKPLPPDHPWASFPQGGGTFSEPRSGDGSLRRVSEPEPVVPAGPPAPPPPRRASGRADYYYDDYEQQMVQWMKADVDAIHGLRQGSEWMKANGYMKPYDGEAPVDVYRFNVDKNPRPENPAQGVPEGGDHATPTRGGGKKVQFGEGWVRKRNSFVPLQGILKYPDDAAKDAASVHLGAAYQRQIFHDTSALNSKWDLVAYEPAAPRSELGAFWKWCTGRKRLSNIYDREELEKLTEVWENDRIFIDRGQRWTTRNSAYFLNVAPDPKKLRSAKGRRGTAAPSPRQRGRMPPRGPIEQTEKDAVLGPFTTPTRVLEREKPPRPPKRDYRTPEEKKEAAEKAVTRKALQKKYSADFKAQMAEESKARRVQRDARIEGAERAARAGKPVPRNWWDVPPLPDGEPPLNAKLKLDEKLGKLYWASP